MISLICFILASMCNSVMDTLSFHYSTSIFNNMKNPSFWNPEISWKNKYIAGNPDNGMRKIFFNLVDYPVFLTDAWHFFKSSMIVLLCVSIATFKIEIFDNSDYKVVTFFVVLYGIFWNLIFDLLYNKILKRKNNN